MPLNHPCGTRTAPRLVELLKRGNWGARHRAPSRWRRKRRLAPLVAHAHECPLATGVYRLYRGKRLLHIGMAAGAATLRSEVLGHARGVYGPATREADRVEWEIAPDAHFAYRRFIALHRELAAPSISRRYSPSVTLPQYEPAESD